LILLDYNLLRGRYVYLERLSEKDIPVIKKLARDEKIWEFTKTILVNEEFDEQFAQYINVPFDPVNKNTVLAFVIKQVTDNSIIGTTRFYDIDEKNKRLNIGYTWYIPSVWGKVHNKECKLLLLAFAFEVLKFNRVGFEVAHQNIRSQKAVEKIGGIKEGELRKYAYRADGSLRNTVIFSIINDEWQVKKKKLELLINQSVKL
jgi:RimJ/RimL family protein N-acetyltransferase